MSIIFTFLTIYALLTLFKMILSNFGHHDKQKKKKVTVRLAVSVPAHNEGQTITRTVQSILAAGMRPENIFILCNGCTDDTAEKVQECGVRPVLAPVKGKEETLNWAEKIAHLYTKGGYTHICFFDADTEIDKEYFRTVKKRLEEDPAIDVLCGRPKSLPRNWLTAHRAVQYSSFHFHKSAQVRMKAILVVPGCAGVYSVKALERLVWSPRTRIGDMDATIQAAKLGMKIVFEPKAVVYTQDPSTIRDYTVQLYRRWNRGLWMNMRIHGLLWSGWTRALNWDCRMIFFDQFAPFLFLSGTLAFEAYVPLLIGLSIFFGLSAVETVMCAINERRPDVLKYVLIFPLLRIYDMLLFFASMPSILIKSEKSGVWTSPKRYE